VVKRFSCLVLLVALSLTGWLSKAVAQQDGRVVQAWRSGVKTGEDLKVLHEFIMGDVKDQKWQTIEWHGDLLEARMKAKKQNRPLFVWAMNGDPLGCV